MFFRSAIRVLATARTSASVSGNKLPLPIMKPPTVLGWGGYCPIAPVPACCWGFLRKPADLAGQSVSQFRTAFQSLSWPFPPRTSLPGTGQKSAKAASITFINQYVNRLRTKRLDCNLGWWRKQIRSDVPSASALVAVSLLANLPLNNVSTIL